MAIVDVVASQSKCKRQKVGALVVKGSNIIAIGYNGTPSGFDNNCECEDGSTHPYVLHAESNAIAKCAKSTIGTSGAILYCTLSPCLECAKLIIQSDISEVYYKQQYRDSSPIELLSLANIKCEKYEGSTFNDKR